ncbi:MAG: M14 family zinc carboxypeptidase [Pseudomonadota bacterium]
MSARVSSMVRVALLALGLGAAAQSQAAPFTYSTYQTMIADLEALEAAYPQLAELSTAQDMFGLPLDGFSDDLSQYILRITNESTGFDKPEVLLVHVQHGDEVVGLEVALQTARLLLEQYGQDEWLTALVDRREIYIMPLANPQGFILDRRSSPGTEASNEDMNRDHVYDRDDCQFFCSDEDSLSTVGGRAIHELARRHLFRVVLDYHGGIELILHPWGSPLHTGNTESPDDVAARDLGLRMRAFGGPFNGLYPVGTANDLLGPANGPLDDTSYAASWDAANSDPLWPTDGWRALGYTIEISNQKRPPQFSLGGDADLLTPGGAEDGYVPKNVRIALAAIDIAEPWVEWTNRDQVATTLEPGDSIDVEWQVRGCFEIDETRVRWGTDADPRLNFDAQTAAQQDASESACFETPTTFQATVSFPEAGTYFVTPVARTDSDLLDQGNPTPSLPPQTWMVRSRNEEGLLATNMVDPLEINTIVGQLYWGADPLEIEVASAADADSDGIADANDNCTLVANPDQRDTNGDGFGNVCDPDFNNDGVVNFSDLGQLKSVFFSGSADEDLDGDGAVNFTDLGVLKQYFFLPPGPAGSL